MQTKSTEPFTLDQWQALNDEQKVIIDAVSEFHTGQSITEDIEPSDESISNSLNILRRCNGCVPDEEIDEQIGDSIRRKFYAVFGTGLELAERELNRRGIQQFEAYNFCILIEPSCQDATHVVIVDYGRAVCYLHEWTKARTFSFSSLAELAEKVISIRNTLVEKVASFVKPKEVYVVLEGGLVREVIGADDKAVITIIDYDIEGADPCEIQPSPIDGERCCITRF